MLLLEKAIVVYEKINNYLPLCFKLFDYAIFFKKQASFCIIFALLTAKSILNLSTYHNYKAT